MIISILEGAVLVDYHPLSLSSFHCDKLKDKLQVTLSPSQSPVALLEIRALVGSLSLLWESSLLGW